MAELKRIFEEAATSESIFQLLTHLGTGSKRDIDQTFRALFETMRDMTNSNVQRSPELLASFGVYLALILRFKPESSYYLEKEHYLSIALKFYYPYVTLFISIMLVPAHLCGIDIDASVIECQDLVVSSSNSSGNQRRSNEEGNRELKMSREAEDAVEKARRISPHNSQIFQPRSPPLGSRENRSETVLEKTAALCGLGSMERNFLFELKRLQGWGVNNFMKRLGLKSQKHEMAIFLDSPQMLEDQLSEDDMQKAIFMHANNVVRSNKANYMPHHFDRALGCLNYPIAKELEHRSDWVSADTLDNLFYTARKFNHALCLELILLAVRKNVELCDHKLKKLPQDWQDRIMEVYSKPRWLSILADDNNKSSIDAIDKYKNVVERERNRNEEKKFHATLEYYRIHFCFPESSTPEILKSLRALQEKLHDETLVAKFIENVRNMNKSFYIFQVSGYMDFLTDNKLTFGNDRDLIGNDIFELSKNFVFIIRENDRLYLLDYCAAKTLIDKGENPYNRQPITPKIRDEILRRFQQYNVAGLGTETTPLSELLQEFLHGRQKLTVCGCARSKNYRRKLIRVLKNYGIKDEHLDLIVIKDVVFKLGLIAIDLKAENLTELCENLYRAIKIARDDCRESLKRAIVSIIRIYSSVLPGGMLVNL